MNRTAKAPAADSPSPLMGTLSIMGFAAEDNLRDVAAALGKRDIAGLSRVNERNTKQSRLRVEIEEQIVEAMAQPVIGTREHRRLILTSQVASMFERMGAQTVEIATLCEQILREPKPGRVADIKKLIEHAVYITDRSAAGLVEEDIEWVKIAQEQKRAAADLNSRINRDLAGLIANGGEAANHADLLCRIACKAYGIIEEAGQLAQDIVAFLEKPEL